MALQVQLLNGSGVAGAADRLTTKLAEVDYVGLPAGNAPQRYTTSAVYYQDGWQDRAEEILQAVEIEEVTAMSQQSFDSEDASVVVLLGTDTAPAVAPNTKSAAIPRYYLVEEDFPLDVSEDRFSRTASGCLLGGEHIHYVGKRILVAKHTSHQRNITERELLVCCRIPSYAWSKRSETLL